MTPKLADDYPAIKERMEQIAKERAEIVPDEPAKEPAIQHHSYMGWDIYAPVRI